MANEQVQRFTGMEFKPSVDQVIEIQIFRKKHNEDEYLSRVEPPDRYHYYIFYAEAKNKDSRPGPMKELNKLDENVTSYEVGKNCVCTKVVRGQLIKWICLYPFTIYYGGTSIITTDKDGWPRPRQIIPYIKATNKDEDGNSYLLDDKETPFYKTRDVYIVNNALSDRYKYFVSVYIPPPADIICVDDPLNIVPPPV